MGEVVRHEEKQEKQEKQEEGEKTHFEGGRQGPIESETSSVQKRLPARVDRGGVCRVGRETRRQRGRLQNLRMGRYAHKRHVLRRGSPESHDRRRRLVSHRVRGETQERHGPRALEGLAR